MSVLEVPLSDSLNAGSTNSPRDNSTPDPFASCGDSKGWPLEGKCNKSQQAMNAMSNQREMSNERKHATRENTGPEKTHRTRENTGPEETRDQRKHGTRETRKHATRENNHENREGPP